MTGESRISPTGIKDPIQLLAAWLVALIVVDGAILAAARLIGSPSWAPGALVITAIVIIPLFLISPFLLLKFFRPELLGNRDYMDWQKRINEATSQQVTTGFGVIASVIDELSQIDKEGVETLIRKLEELDRSRPAVLTLVLGKREPSDNKVGYYDPYALQYYIDVLTKFPFFKGIAILGKRRKLQAYIPYASTVAMVVSNSLPGFVKYVNEADIDNIRRLPGVVTEFLSDDTTNIDALAKLTEQGLDSLVVEGNGELRGVIDKQDLLAKLVLAVAGSGQAVSRPGRSRQRARVSTG